MPRVAQLPNGHTLEFPDHTPDSAIDETVKAHLQEHIDETARDAAEKEEALRREREKEGRRFEHTRLLHDEGLKYRMERDRRDEMRHGMERQFRDVTRQEDITHRTQSAAETQAYHQQKLMMHNQTNELLSQLIGATVTMASRIDNLEVSIKGMSALGERVDELAATVERGIDTIAEKLGRDKKIVFDQRGRPVGLTYDDDDALETVN